MRVLYIGNTRNLDSFGKSFNTEAHIARDLRALGHTVDEFQEPPGGGDHDTLNQIARRAEGCTLLLWTRTWGLPEDATKLWRYLEGEGVTTASYHLDLYLGLARQANIESDPFWTTQHVFTPDGNESSAEWFAAHDINHHWSPPGVVSDECATVMPGTYRPELDHDVVFVGSAGWPASYHQEWPWRAELLAWLEQTYGDRYHRYDGLSGYPSGRKHVPGPIRGQALNDLYASCKVVVGDSLGATPAQMYWSDRAFEGYGRGAYMVFPWINRLAEMIGPYPSYSVGDFDRIAEQIEYGLGDEGERKDTVEFLSTEVAAGHTYIHRLAAALDVMGLG